MINAFIYNQNQINKHSKIMDLTKQGNYLSRSTYHNSTPDFQCSVVQNKKNPQKYKTGAWTSKQTLKFITYIRFNLSKIKSKQLRKEYKIFKQMAKYIRTRDPTQCRSQNQQMLKIYGSYEQLIEGFEKTYGKQSFQVAYDKFQKEEFIIFETNQAQDIHGASMERKGVEYKRVSQKEQGRLCEIILSPSELQKTHETIEIEYLYSPKLICEWPYGWQYIYLYGGYTY